MLSGVYILPYGPYGMGADNLLNIYKEVRKKVVFFNDTPCTSDIVRKIKKLNFKKLRFEIKLLLMKIV